MSNRLLSFLSDFERSLEADQPSSSEGAWECSRMVNYRMGLARLELGMRPEGGKLQPKGTILLQGYNLADETQCLKAELSWTGVQGSVVRSIFSKPDVNWTSEARKVAAEWMGGPPAGIDQTPALSEAPAPMAPVAAAAYA